MLQPGRKYSAGSLYRYGYNGKEEDDEVKGDGNQIDYGMRIYDPRLGRFLSIDPVTKDFPSFSPYIYAANTPIIAIDQNGKYAVWTHYRMTYKYLRRAGIERKTAREIAHYASTFADHPTSGILKVNQALALKDGENPAVLSYDTETYGSYDYTKESQSDHFVTSVSIHAMKTWFEDISEEEAINRALYGGKYKEKDGTEVTIIGAYDVIEYYKGKGVKNLSREEKKLYGLALHTIQDAQIHKGKRWVAEHKKEAKKLGHSNEHPDLGCAVFSTNLDKAENETEKAVNKVEGKTKSFFNKMRDFFGL